LGIGGWGLRSGLAFAAGQEKLMRTGDGSRANAAACQLWLMSRPLEPKLKLKHKLKQREKRTQAL